jgi:hypothetical protein
MEAILLKAKNLEPGIIELIYDKQHLFTKEKKRKVSLEQTINRLLKEAYLKESTFDFSMQPTSGLTRKI